MASRRRKLCVVTPCFNEQDVVADFHRELVAVWDELPELEHQVIFVDDGSRDATLARLNELAAKDDRVVVLSLSRNFGHQIALSAGLDHARADAVILMDSDLQHPPSLIPQMVELWQTKDCDIVSAVRSFTSGVGAMKRFSSSAFYRIINLLSDTRVEPGAADFCLLSRRARRALCRMPERHRFLRGMVSWLGFERVLIPYQAAARTAGESKFTATKMIRLALDAVFSFSTVPIRAASQIGILFMMLGVVYLVYIVYRALRYGDLVQGWGSIMGTLLIVSGLQFVMLGVFGGYVGRIFDESKRRPLYLLKQGPRRSRRKAR
jgi:dolichol-phosphate mannosyltransferase